MISFSFISLVSALLALCCIILALSIFNKVFQENYKKPWLYMGIAALFFGVNQLLRFLYESVSVIIVNTGITLFLILILDFIAIAFLAYGLLLELLILKFYKGKFVKFHLIPVQEERSSEFAQGGTEIAFKNATAYYSRIGDERFLRKNFAAATRSGFEGFLVTEEPPKSLRIALDLKRTPIVWLKSQDQVVETQSFRASLDENSELVDPLELNNLIGYVDSFLEQSQRPFIMMTLDTVLKANNFAVVIEFVRYISSKVVKRGGVFVAIVNIKQLRPAEIDELERLLEPIEGLGTGVYSP